MERLWRFGAAAIGAGSRWLGVALVIPALLFGANGCDEGIEASGCSPGAGRFGDRCCGGVSDCQTDLTCVSSQCTKACDASADCEGLEPDGGNRGCRSDGFCATPPLPLAKPPDPGQGW
jgi:hypothetical protein